MKIICAGVRRSGSTWLFNTVKSILRSSGQEIYYNFISPTNDFKWEHDNEVIKMHHFDETICRQAEFVLTTKRDWKDIAASAVRRGSLTNDHMLERNFRGDSVKEIEDFIIEEIRNYKAWKPHSSLEISYPNIINDTIKTIESIALTLMTHVDPKTIKDLVDNMKPPLTGVDPDTQLWHNHITDGGCKTYQNILSDNVICKINEIIYGFI